MAFAPTKCWDSMSLLELHRETKKLEQHDLAVLLES
jgi:hypothetical protein